MFKGGQFCRTPAGAITSSFGQRFRRRLASAWSPSFFLLPASLPARLRKPRCERPPAPGLFSIAARELPKGVGFGRRPFHARRANEKPGCELHANRVSPSAEVSSLNGGCWRWRVTRAAYAVAQSATFQLNSPKMAVHGQKRRNFNQEVRFLSAPSTCDQGHIRLHTECKYVGVGSPNTLLRR